MPKAVTITVHGPSDVFIAEYIALKLNEIGLSTTFLADGPIQSDSLLAKIRHIPKDTVFQVITTKFTRSPK